jgi:hypothetical protein
MLPIQRRSPWDERASRTLTVTSGSGIDCLHMRGRAVLADCHLERCHLGADRRANCAAEKTRPGRTLLRSVRAGLSYPLEAVIRLRITYCFGGVFVSAGGGAFEPSAAGAAGASEAGAAGAEESDAGAAGAAAVSAAGAAGGLAASCFAQAVSISAATIALRASLVFIDRYPEEKQEWCENETNELARSASSVRIAAANSIGSTRDWKQ